MDDSGSSGHPRSLPSQVQHLLEATEGSAQEQAWSSFLDAYSRLILYVARQTPGDHDAIMDRYAFVVERLRERDFRRLRTYAADGRGKFTTWLTVVVRRLCLDHHRFTHGRAPAPSRPPPPRRLVELVTLDPQVLDRFPDAGPSPEDELHRQQIRERLDSLLATLSPSDRLLVALRYHDDCSAREIASIMSFPTPFHVYRQLKRVHDQLRQGFAVGGGARESQGPSAVQWWWER